jgi:hypothetical protein
VWRTILWGTQWGQLDSGEVPVVASLQGSESLRCEPPFSELLCSLPGEFRCNLGYSAQDSYLVDSASSHMLVSKIKPCMSKYKQSIR